MKRMYKRAAGILAVLLGVAILAGVFPGKKTVVQAQEADAGRVLFISSYSYAWDTVQLQIEGIQNGIADGVVLDYEFMDTKRVNDETAYELFYEGLSYRMSKVEPYDVIIVGDDAAFHFALAHKDDLFAGIPIVFEGVNDEALALEASQNPMVTGVIEKLSVRKNIELALSIYPDANKVVAILDDSVTGEAERKNFYANAEVFPELTFAEINTSELTTAKLKSELAALDESTILIYVTMTEDASGKQYTNKESIELIGNFASVPAFRMVEGGIGWGVLGGNIVSMELSGEIAAGIAMDIINGNRNVEIIQVVEDSPNIYCIDEIVMEKFGIDKGVFPKDTVFVNHKADFFERNQELLKPVTILGVIILLVTGWACIDNVKRRKLTAELEEARMYLEDASQHDFLTGLPNRSKFMKDLQEIVDSKKPFTIIMMDIDNFKHINDEYGHIIGDAALKEVAARLKMLKTSLFTAYRYAGDEFILILKSDNHKIVDTAAMQCLNVFDKPFKLEGKTHIIHGSVGVATAPKDTTDGEELIICADAAMYSVKKGGKNAYAYYKEGMINPEKK